jgi:hypothetical protein
MLKDLEPNQKVKGDLGGNEPSQKKNEMLASGSDADEEFKASVAGRKGPSPKNGTGYKSKMTESDVAMEDSCNQSNDN